MYQVLIYEQGLSRFCYLMLMVEVKKGNQVYLTNQINIMNIYCKIFSFLLNNVFVAANKPNTKRNQNVFICIFPTPFLKNLRKKDF